MGTARDVVGAASSIIHSGGEDWCARDFPFPEVVSCLGVCRRTGVRDLSGVRRTGDCPSPNLSDSVLFRLGWEERALSGVFRYFRVLNLLPAPQPLADCARQPRPLLLRIGSRTEIRVEPGRAHALEFRRAEATSECPRTDHSSTVCISRGWK